MTWTLLLAVLVLFLLVSAVLSRYLRRRQAEHLVEHTRSIINFSYAGPASANVRDRLRLRAEANKRLLRAFEIRSSFTTTDLAVHQEFARAASKGLKPTNAVWQKLYEDATVLLNKDAREAVHFPLAPVVRSLCLRIVLAAFFDADPFSASKQDVACVTDEINRQWMLSKRDPCGVFPSEYLRRAVMNLGLKSLLSRNKRASADEALSFIIPAYETLWRVVLLVFVKAYHRTPDHATIAEMVKNVPACLGIPGREDEALKVAKEGLRLYPSTKRIHRAASPDATAPLLSAEVEKCHTHADIWGADTLDFRPARFDNLTALQERAYVPFGLAPHKCPAHSGFGNRLVTMLVAVLGRTLPAGKALVYFHDAKLDDSIHPPLPTGRGDMEDWDVIWLTDM